MNEQAEKEKAEELPTTEPVTVQSYADLFRGLEQLQAPYVTTSGMAVVLHGHQRPTFDLDIVISAKPAEQSLALQALMMAGFVPTLMLPLQLVTVLRMFDQSEREVDVFVKYHIPFDELWPDSALLEVTGCAVRVVSLAHLLQIKRATGRPHDLEDVAGLLRLQRKVTSKV